MGLFNWMRKLATGKGAPVKQQGAKRPLASPQRAQEQPARQGSAQTRAASSPLPAGVTKQGQGEQNSGGKRYYNKEWNFSIVYPADWELLWENRSQGSWVMAVAVAGRPGGRVRPGLIVNVRRGEVLEGSTTVTVTHIGQDGSVAQTPKTPGEYIEKSKEDLKRAFSGLRFLSGEETRLINKPATRVVYAYDTRSGRMQEMCVTIFGVGVTFQITCEVAPEQFDVFKLVFDDIIRSFNIGSEPCAPEERVAAGPATGPATPAQVYNRGVSLYQKGQFKSALDAFGEVFRSGQLQMQAAYAHALCQKELGLPVEIPPELGDRAVDAGPIYVATNLAYYLIGKGHKAALTKEGSTSEVTAVIDGARYVVSVSSLFGGFNNWAWRKDGEKSISIPDPSANPNPTKTDKLVISLTEQASSLPMSPLPAGGLKSALE